MALEVEAIYDHGALKPFHEVPLQEGQKVKITIHSTGSAVIAGLGVGAGLEPEVGPLAAAYVLILAVLGPILARAVGPRNGDSETKSGGKVVEAGPPSR